nr:hypothetical protein CFP56_23604 [Quercus suber]
MFVYPSLQFKGFQSILSQKIGISPHQFSVYLNPGTGRVGGDNESHHQRRLVLPRGLGVIARTAARTGSSSWS